GGLRCITAVASAIIAGFSATISRLAMLTSALAATSIPASENAAQGECQAVPGHYSHRFSVAPMLDWTDRHERYFLRLLSRHALLYTEMVTTGALLHGDAARHLRFDSAEHP